MARLVPVRTMASRGAPRKERCVPRYTRASSTLVFPVPLGPVITVVPSVSGVKAAAAKIRKLTSSRTRRLTAKGCRRSGDPYGHEEIAELVVLGAAHGGRLRSVCRLD